MRKDPVGYRFSPTGEELINHYLKNKIYGKTWLVDEAISEINICSYEPKSLPSLAKMKSDDLEWYFFCPREYKSDKNKTTKRTTGSGFWKPTGKDRTIKDKRGKGVEIGLKKTLVYYEGKVPNEVRTPWVIHEFHITCLPQIQRTYVICQVKYKGEDGDILYGISNSNEPSHSLASVSNTVPEHQLDQTGQEEEHILGLSMDDLVSPVIHEQNGLSLSHDGFNPKTLLSENINPNVVVQQQPQTPCDDAYFDRLVSYNGGNFDDVINTTSDQVEQLGEENFNGLSVNDLLMPINQQNDPNTFLFSDYYNNYNINPQLQTYEEDDFINGLMRFEDEEFVMQANRNEHRPKKALSGVFVDSSSDSDSDAESISAMSYQGISSPIPSCSSTDSCKDLQTSADSSISRKTTKKSQLTRRTVTSKQEVLCCSMDKEEESLVKKKEKKGLFILEETMERNRKNPRYIYFINMIIGFILLLALIANIKT